MQDVKHLQDVQVDNLDEQEAYQVLNNLYKLIKHHDLLYHAQDQPDISDAEYDFLVNLAKSIESKFPNLKDPTIIEAVGSSTLTPFEKVRHKVPMLSLANAYTIEDIEDFYNRINRFIKTDNNFDLCGELKIDGVSFSALYINGNLSLGLTRGDGVMGENITNNIKTIHKLPHKIVGVPEEFEVRGEIYITKEDFKNLQYTIGDKKFSNPRNLAAGSLRQLNAKDVALRPIKYMVYGIGYNTKNVVDKQSDLLNFLLDKGFCINTDFKIIKSIEEAQKFYSTFMEKRNSLEYEIDGIVYKVDNLAMQKRLGATGKSPRFAIAYKFPEVLGLTKLLDVELQIGRTGSITPVAYLEKICIGGVIVSKASLHNFEYIEKRDIRIGDYVFLKRAGDVIPYISHVDLSKRISDLPKINIPDKCPVCCAKIDNTDIVIRCTNYFCSAQVYARIIHFISKQGANIVGFAAKQVQKLKEKNLLNKIQDIFYLKNKQEVLNTLEGLGKKNIANLLSNIEQARNISLEKFIYSLGIRHVGSGCAELIAKELKTGVNFFGLLKFISSNVVLEERKVDIEYEKKMNFTNNDYIEAVLIKNLMLVDGIGKKVLYSLQDFASNKENINLVKDLIGIMKIDDFVIDTINSSYYGKKIVFTGTFDGISRAELKEQAKKLGMQVVSTISAKTDFLLHGDKPSRKLAMAQEMEIQLLNIGEWNEIVLSILK